MSLAAAFWVPVFLFYAMTLAGGALVALSAIGAAQLRRRRRDALLRRLAFERWRQHHRRQQPWRPRQPRSGPMR